MSNKWQQRPLVQPRETNLGNRAGAPAYYDACISRKSHQQIARVSHSAGNDHGGGPIRWWHLVRRNDADYQASRSDGAFGRHSRGRTSASTDYRDAEFREQRACLASQLVRSGSRLGATENADLGTTV
jgi:hypothetical protein